MDYKHVHFVGIGGIGMSALAQHLSAKGIAVSGSDQTASEITQKLVKLGIKVSIGHCKENITSNVDLVVRTSAVSENNVEVVTAKSKGVPVVLREELLGMVFNTYSTKVAVCGTHGKTTTTALISHVLSFCGVSHTCIVGGESGGNNYKSGENIIVAEACEYNESFRFLNPDVIVCLNIDYDHPDCYESKVDVENAFRRFFSHLCGGTLVANSNISSRVISSVQKVVTFCSGGKYQAQNITTHGKLCFDVTLDGKYLCHINSNLQGKHNVENILGVVATARQLGLNVHTVCQAVGTFAGTERRFSTVKSSVANVIEDYAHHPTQIRAVVETARQNANGRVVVAFQPHTFSRTKAFWTNFALALSLADEVVLLPVYPAREVAIEGISSENLAQSVNKLGTVCHFAESFVTAYSLVKSIAKPCDTVLVLGAGSIHTLAEMLQE